MCSVLEVMSPSLNMLYLVVLHSSVYNCNLEKQVIQWNIRYRTTSQVRGRAAEKHDHFENL